MARKATMEFKRGDNVTHSFSMPASSWSAGGTLFFAAKPIVDNDNADVSAVINKPFDDSVVSNVIVNGVSYKKYTLAFVPSDISPSVVFSGTENKKTYLGEFQYKYANGSINSFPGNNNYIDTVIYADIKRATS